MGIKIIGFNLSPNALKTLCALEELGIEYEYEQPEYPEIKSPEYLAKKHPFGKVPVMIDGDFTVYESRAICRYLLTKYQGTKNTTILIPNDLQKATLVEQFLSVESSEFDIPVSTIIYQEIILKFLGKETNTEKVKEAKEKLEKTLDVYEKILEGKDYLTGEYSLADLSHIPGIVACIDKTSSKDIFYDAKRPNVVKWVKRLYESPAWKQVVAKHKIN